MPIDWAQTVLAPLHKVFAEPMTYTPLGGRPFQITGVFDDAYLKEVLFDDASASVTEVSACVGIQLSEFPAMPKQNDQLFVPANPSLLRLAATYVVRQPRTDSHGASRLLLSKMTYP